MLDDPLGIMRQLAQASGVRISAINVYDANVCSWTRPAGRPWEPKLVSGEPFLKQVRYPYRGRRVKVFGNSSFLSVSIGGSFPTQPFSVNEIDLNNLLLQNRAIPNATGYCVFTETGDLSFDQRSIINRIEFSLLMRELALQTGEKLGIFRNNISVYLKKPSMARVSACVDGLTTLAARIEIMEKELDFSILPSRFHTLIPLIMKWAIDDDLDRENLLENLPRTKLEKFVEEVEPYLQPIDSYLGAFGQYPPSEAVCALGRLAECAAEAKRLLEKNPLDG
jgi:hypothetical protein